MATESGLFVFLGRGFVQMFEQIVSIRVMTLINRNVVASRLIKIAKRPCSRLLSVAQKLRSTLYVATKKSRIPPNPNFPGETNIVFNFLFKIIYI